jgi:hypothetical protein
MASKNGSKPRSNDEYDGVYFLGVVGVLFLVALPGGVDFADDDLVDDLVDDADDRCADCVSRWRVVP